ncbi:MAG TPA: sulfite exporter TauE/SafE family protein, partial [Hellea balneolensis]|nr:sulfite exporter TauE/SafE family protein [Hellea balneolensis]
AGAYNWGEIWPFLILSIPCAWLGGRISIPEHIFTGLLALALFIAGLILLFGHNLDKDRPTHNAPPLNAVIGAGLGFVSGLVGIGGGIFLAPILHLINWGKPKHIAALCSLFILVNSVAGLGGQMVKFLGAYTVSDLFPYLPLALAVLTGGYIGNRLGLNVFSQNTVKKLTAVLILFVASRLLWQVYATY